MSKKEMAAIDEMLSNGKLMRGDDPRLVVQRIPFDIPDLDGILNGGIPRHRISIVTGQYSSGKSLIIQLFMKNALKQGLQVAYIDTEQTYDPVWWGQVGLPIDQLFVSQPIIGEDAINVAVALVKANVDVVAIDSLAALIPHEEAEEKAEKKFVALQARLISKLMRLLLSTKHNSAVICTNQLRDSIGTGPYPQDVMPGGQAQGFFMSVLLRCIRTDWIKDGETKLGFNIKVICRKSKVGVPFGECVLPFLFRGEIDLISLLIDRAIESGIIDQKGPYYYLNFGGLNGEKVLGRNTMLTKINAEPELQEHLKKALGDL